MTSGSLWNYHRNEINDPASKNNDAYNYRMYNNKTTTIKSFEYKTKIIEEHQTIIIYHTQKLLFH